MNSNSNFVQVVRSKEGELTLNVPVGAIDWGALLQTLLPIILQILQALLVKPPVPPAPPVK